LPDHPPLVVALSFLSLLKRPFCFFEETAEGSFEGAWEGMGLEVVE
jgi:hypothetical protein